MNHAPSSNIWAITLNSTERHVKAKLLKTPTELQYLKNVLLPTVVMGETLYEIKRLQQPLLTFALW